MIDRRKASGRRSAARAAAGRRKSDSLSGHIPGLVKLERWQLIDRALAEVDQHGHVTVETWGIMSARDRALFAQNAPDNLLACGTK